MPNDTWTIKRCLDWTRDYLQNKGDERPRLSAEWLLSSVTGLSRTQLYVSFDKPLAQEELSSMHAAVVRRAKGEPLQYITGETAFRMLTVACEPGVLIPRPETELLVEEVLEFLDSEVLGTNKANPLERARVELPWNAEVEAARLAELKATAEAKVQDTAEAKAQDAAQFQSEKAVEESEAAADVAIDIDSKAASVSAEIAALAASDRADGFDCEAASSAPCQEASLEKDTQPRIARVLEVGCGTGCISLSLASERAGRVTCVATDIEPRAIALSERNRELAGLSAENVDFRLGNLVSPLDRNTEWGTFDVLVSNPPYIPSKVMQELPHEVAAFEPELALDGGVDGLDIFRRLVNAAPHMLRKGGLLACELYEGHLDAAADLCRAASMTDVRIVNDLTNRPRIILARV